MLVAECPDQRLDRPRILDFAQRSRCRCPQVRPRPCQDLNQWLDCPLVPDGSHRASRLDARPAALAFQDAEERLRRPGVPDHAQHAHGLTPSISLLAVQPGDQRLDRGLTHRLQRIRRGFANLFDLVAQQRDQRLRRAGRIVRAH